MFVEVLAEVHARPVSLRKSFRFWLGGATACVIRVTCDGLSGTTRDAAFTLWPEVCCVWLGTTFIPKEGDVTVNPWV